LIDKCFIVVPWVREEEREAFLREWNINPRSVPDWLILQHDERREGCARTKNAGIARAVVRGADVVVVLDGDCYPHRDAPTLEILAEHHVSALKPQPVRMFDVVTDPPSRGTPYGDLTITMPVAASMGFWTDVGDYCAVRQLAHGPRPMTFVREAVHGRSFPLCGMNLAFRPAEWAPWCTFVDVPRFDDIWMGWLWQREAYARGACFNLAGPLVRHSRQSNVWRNLRDEARFLEANEALWREIAAAPDGSYEALARLLPKRDQA
jgi:hypothetical protein